MVTDAMLSNIQKGNPEAEEISETEKRATVCM